MTDLPELRNGRLPMGEGRKSRGRAQPFDIDLKTEHLIQAMVVGVDAERRSKIPSGI